MAVRSVPVTQTLLLVEAVTHSMVSASVCQVFKVRTVTGVKTTTSSSRMRRGPSDLLGRLHLTTRKAASHAPLV